MPFVALDPERGERVYILDYWQPKVQLAGRQLVCPLCKARMIIRDGDIYIRHFAHRQHCPYAGWSHADTPEHRAAKVALMDWLKRDPFWRDGTIEPEAVLADARRKADVLVTFPDGTRVAHECQLSRITEKGFSERGAAYQRSGVVDFWWFRDRTLAHRADLAAMVAGHQGLTLTMSIIKEPNPYRDDPEHRQHHTAPRRVILWLSHPALSSPNPRNLTAGPALSPAEQRQVWWWILWGPVRRVLEGATDWLNAGAIRARLHPVWQARFTVEDIDNFLVAYWEIGGAIAGPDGGWLLPYLPGFNPLHWLGWWRRQEVGAEVEDACMELSIRYHCEWWAEQIRQAGSLDGLEVVRQEIARCERSPQVRERLRPLYRQRRAALTAICPGQPTSTGG